MKIAEFSVKNSQFTFIVFMAFMALGAMSLFNMPRAEDPKFTPPGYVVIMVYPGAGPTEVEDQITDKVEAALSSLEDIDRMRSQSLSGAMLLSIEFLPGSDSDQKYEEVLREVNAIRSELPDDIYRTEIRRFTSSDVAILQSALVSENASFELLRREAERLEEMLEKISALKGAETWAFPKKDVRINLNLAKMAAAGLPVSRVLSTLQSENLSIPGGAINAGDRQFVVQTSGNYESVEEVKNTILNSNNGKIIYLKDVADVDLAYEEPRHEAALNGVRCVYVTARMKDGQNITAVGDQVNKVIEQFKKDLPPSIDYVKIFDQDESVTKRLARFAKDFGIAILLVLLTLLPLGWRAALVVMISIPLSIAIGLLMLDHLDYSLNQLSIVGLIIALGILVDDSIVVVENIERWLRDGYSRRDAAILATKQIGLAVLGCTATLILAFLPLLYLPGASGDFIRSLPAAVVTTVLASLFVSLTIVPFLGSRVLAEHHDPRGNIILRGMKWVISKSYSRLLYLALRWPKTTLLASALIFFASVYGGKALGFVLFPASERPMFYIDIEMAAGANFEATRKATAFVDSVLGTYMAPGVRIEDMGIRRTDTSQAYGEQVLAREVYPGRGAPARVVRYSSNVGRGNPRVYYNVIREVESAEYGQIFVQLQEKTPPDVKLALIDTLRQQLDHYPGARINVKNFEQGPPTDAPVSIRILGNNLDTLRRLADEVERIMAAEPGAIYLENPSTIVRTDLKVSINKEKAVALGIPIAEIDRTVRLAIAGLNVGKFTANADGLDYNLIVTLPKSGTFPDQRVFEQLYVNSVAGFAVPLNQVASLSLVPSPSAIQRYNRERFTIVQCFVQNGYFASTINTNLQQKLSVMQFPSGYSFKMAGEVENAERSFNGIGAIVIVTIFGLLAVLILEFRTFKSTIVVLSVIPLGVIGAIAALYLTGYPFSFTAVVGLIALMGIEVKNSILLVDFTNQLRAEGRSLDEAIREAGEIRFVPILLTSLTAIGGLIPIAIEHNPLYSPLAWVLIGGLVSSTLLSRIVTPVLYRVLAPRVV
jgi:multidrug efflux pump subunit AcrB